MQPQTNFTVGTPCKEDWSQMTAQEQGRFCALCQKCVVDLTTKSQQEIKEIYDENEGNVCGRMTVRQIEEAKQPKTPKIYWFGQGLHRAQRVALAFFAAFMIWFAPVHAQYAPPPPPVKGEIVLMGDVMPDPEKQGGLSGKIYWKDGLAANDLTVSVGDQTVPVEAGHYNFERLSPGNKTLTIYSNELKREVYRKNFAMPWNQWLTKDIVLETKAPKKAVNIVDKDAELVPDELVTLGQIVAVPQEIPEQEFIMGKMAPVFEEEEEELDSVPSTEIILEGLELHPSTCTVGPLPSDILPLTGESLESAPDIDEGIAAEAESSETFAEKEGLKAFPNPTRDQLSLEFPKPLTGEVVLRIHNIDGSLLKEIDFQADGVRSYKVSLSEYSKGIYLISVESQGYAAETKVVKL